MADNSFNNQSFYLPAAVHCFHDGKGHVDNMTLVGIDMEGDLFIGDSHFNKEAARVLLTLVEGYVFPESVAALRVRQGALKSLPARPEPPGRFTDDYGQRLTSIHQESDDCREHGCTIHNPSEDSEAIGKRFWRADRGIMERQCQHGVGHPDPDSVRFWQREHGDDFASLHSVHGCDGCCSEPYGVPGWSASYNDTGHGSDGENQ